MHAGASTGAMVFVLIGYRKVSPLMLGPFRLMLTTVVAPVGIFTVLLVVEPTFGEYNEAKDSLARPALCSGRLCSSPGGCWRRRC